jgi:hypothetical protein
MLYCFRNMGAVMQTRVALYGVLLLSVALAQSSAVADVTISSDATQNMSCSGGICAPTAKKAVLNVGDLETLLASSAVTVTTTNSGVQAMNIVVSAPLGWSSTNRLAFQSYQSIAINSHVSVAGVTQFSLSTNESEPSFGDKGSVTFHKLSSSLTINGTLYTLVSSVASLAIAANSDPSGAYALAADYNADKDGTYSHPPVTAEFTGSFEGLGNRISGLSISDTANGDDVGLFQNVGQQAILANVKLSNVSIGGTAAKIAALAGYNSGTIEGSQAGGLIYAANEVTQAGTVAGLVGQNDGVIVGSRTAVRIRPSKGAASGGIAGGLVAVNNGTIIDSSSSATIYRAAEGTEIGGLVGHNDQPGVVKNSHATLQTLQQYGTFVGGLVGENDNVIDQCFAKGEISGGAITVGGLVSFSGGPITNSYAATAVTGKLRRDTESLVGGLIGQNFSTAADSYSTGKVRGTGPVLGGLIGDDEADSGSISNGYWDVNTSGITNLSQGAGNIVNDPGITGLTTTELQSQLPAGFDPAVWAENPNINNGLPYLIANPPQ